jgi:lysophospholipase L1-like esterase
MKHIRLIPILLAAIPLVSNAQQAASASVPPPAAPPEPPKLIVDVIDPKDGDTVVFLGDSITHQCLYTQYVEDYFYTRYPKARIRFHNAGVGGDRAKDALNRFDEDVAAYKPKYVTILLGMNDGTYTDFQKPVFDTYQRDMNTVLDRIAEIGAVAVPMTPTMHDAGTARHLL